MRNGELNMALVMMRLGAFAPAISKKFLPHFRVYYEVVSIHTGVLPYTYRTIMEMFLKSMKLC